MIRLIFNHFRSIRFLIKKQRAKELYSISGLINPLTAHINDNFYVNTECEEYFLNISMNNSHIPRVV